MAIQWSGLSPELLVRLDRSAGQPLRAQLEASLREAIRSGRLRGGERLPSSRELARELGVSRGMVQDCYGQLLAEGYLTSRTGSATRVADIAAGSRRPRRGPPRRGAGPPGQSDRGLRPGRAGPVELPARRLGLGRPRGLRRGRLRRPGLRRSARQPVLREVLAGYLRRVRAAAADPARMIISTGFAQGVNLVLRALSRQARRHVRGLRGPRLRQRRGGRDGPRGRGDGHAVVPRAGRRATGSWSARWRPAGPRPSWSPRRTSRPPAWC